MEETKMESESAVTDNAGQVPFGNDKTEAEVSPSPVETSVENVPSEAERKSSESVAKDVDDETIETVEPLSTGDSDPVEEKAPEDKEQQGPYQPCVQDGEGSKASNDSAAVEVKNPNGDDEAAESPEVPDSEPMLGMEVDNKAPQSDKENESADIKADGASTANDKLDTEMQTPTTDASEGNTDHSEVREEDKDQANSSNDNMLESMVVSELTTCESLEMDVDEDEEPEVLKTVEGDETEDKEAKSHKVISSDQDQESEVLKTKEGDETEDKELESHEVISSAQDQELEELKMEEGDDTKDEEVKSPKVVSVDKGDEEASVSIDEIKEVVPEKTEAEGRGKLDTPEDSTKIVECDEKKIDECAGMEEADGTVVTIQETDSLMEVEEANVDTEKGKSRSTSKEKETSQVTKPTEKEEAIKQSTLIVEDEELKSADAIVDAKEVKEDDVVVTPEAQEKSTASEPSESPQEPQEKLVEEKKDPTEESNCMPEKKTAEEQKDEEDDDIILIDDENTTAEESESKGEKPSDQEKNEPEAKKLRLSTEEKEKSKMDTADDQDSTAADLNKASEKSEDVTKNDEDKPQQDKVVSEDEDVVLIENDPKPSGKVEEKGDEKTGVEKDKLVEKDDEKPSVSEKEDKSEVKKDDSDEVMVVESEKSDSKKSPNDPNPDEKEAVGTSGDKTDKPQKEDEKVEGKSETAKVDDSKDKAAQNAAESKTKDQGETEKGTPTKRFVLDENTGMFEEKETAPEETVPQVFGDSDEDVVMVDNYVTTDRKSASKPPSKTLPQVATTATSATPSTEQKTAPPEKSEPAAKEPSKPKSSTVSVECINAECKKDTRETAPAPAFVLNFFGIPKKTKKQRICLSCYDEVVQKYSVLGGAVLDQQPLLFCEMPRKNELVEISDSSEEEEDADVKLEAEKPLPADIIALVESELNDIVSSTFEKINISQQIDWTEQIMKQKIAYNTKLSDEINNELNELQRKVDRIHLKLYSKSRPRYQDLPPINIFEVDANRQSIIQQPIQANRQYSPQRPFGQTVQQQQQQQQIQQKQASQVTLGTQASAVSPPKEEFTRPAVSVGQFYFAVKHKLLSNWAECQVVEAVTVADKSLYKVNFLYNQGVGNAPIKVVPAKYLAYRHSFNVKLPLGTRVIARFDAGTTQPTLNKSQQAKSNSFYPGIIAESFGKYNRNRYLIFFDDGYAQYVTHGDVRVVCEESKEVWLDIHPHSQEFIKNYLMNYRSQRPMVQVKVGQRIITEWKGKWIYAKVIDIDASLVQLHFPDDNRYEWIYRGSTRLGPLYQEKALSMSKASNKFSKFQKRNEPSIEYITLDDDDDDTEQAKQLEPKKVSTPQEQALQALKNLQMSQADSAANRSVAKKSTFHRATPASQPSAVFMNSSTIYCEDDRPKGKIVYYTAKKHLPPLKYKPHDCNPNCLFKITHNLKSYSPMAKPLLSGWERQLCKMRYKKVFVVYRAPCGRRVRNMYELHMYLRMTKATLNVENFDFDPMIHCLAEYVIENHIYHNPDLSDGKEFMAVPCVNYFDDTKPPPCIYSTERIPTEGVNLNLDSDFLCGCDCEDDCMDKSRCQCWQLTIAGAKFGNPNTSIDNIGYVYKRLQEPVVTGIYECNSRCKCKMNCLNRVVQHPLMTKLQVFKTSNRGWGIRCLNDVAKGSFICIYSGHLLTEEAGNTICEMNENKAGDEYFADLDYIETVEQLKEGYETDVVESDSDADSDEPDYDAKQDSGASDDDFTASTNPTDAAVKTRSQVRRDSRSSAQKSESKSEKKSSKKKEDNKNGSDDEREMVNLIPNSDMTKGDAPSPAIKYRSVRKYFGKHEQIYIMDAKKSGNLGRYFNHSCNPNLFVQNVFVDTHDLRFPWVAFFALCNVRAGSELTWNYNYDVGSVPGKVLYCQCGAENCRQRLL